MSGFQKNPPYLQSLLITGYRLILYLNLKGVAGFIESLWGYLDSPPFSPRSGAAPFVF